MLGSTVGEVMSRHPHTCGAGLSLPAAAKLVLGYGAAFPEGDGCWPYAPMLPPDVKYLRSKMQQLNQVLREVTEAVLK